MRDEGERAEEAAWRESERRHAAARRAANRSAWHEFHVGQAAHHRAVVEGLIARHEAEALRLTANDDERKEAHYDQEHPRNR